MTAFMIDEMFSPSAATLLRDKFAHDAVHVSEVGLQAAEDAVVAAAARAFVLKRNLPQGGGQAAALAKALDRWAREQPDPYLGPHWPQV